MKITREIQEKSLFLLQQGYSAKSVSQAVNLMFAADSNPSDMLILAKRNNIKVGIKDLTKEKIKIKEVIKALPILWQNKEYRKKIIKYSSFIVLAIATITFICHTIWG